MQKFSDSSKGALSFKKRNKGGADRGNTTFLDFLIALWHLGVMPYPSTGLITAREEESFSFTKGKETVSLNAPQLVHQHLLGLFFVMQRI